MSIFSGLPDGAKVDTALSSTSQNPVSNATVAAALEALTDSIGSVAHVEVGTYTGTGTYGSSNESTLTFGFTPRMVFVYRDSFYHTYSGYYYYPSGFGTSFQIFLAGVTMFYTTKGNTDSKTTYSLSQTLAWNSPVSAEYQMNGSNTTYHYIAIG